MFVTLMPYIAAVGGRWRSVGGQLVASGVLLASGYQDLGLRVRIGAIFGFSMALAFGVSALATAISERLSADPTSVVWFSVSKFA